jgi:hypothetical protein
MDGWMDGWTAGLVSTYEASERAREAMRCDGVQSRGDRTMMLMLIVAWWWSEEGRSKFKRREAHQRACLMRNSGRKERRLD